MNVVPRDGSLSSASIAPRIRQLIVDSTSRSDREIEEGLELARHLGQHSTAF